MPGPKRRVAAKVVQHPAKRSVTITNAGAERARARTAASTPKPRSSSGGGGGLINWGSRYTQAPGINIGQKRKP